MKKLLLSSAIIIACISSVRAQWTQQTSNVTANYYVPFIDVVTDSIVWGIVSDPANQMTPVAEFTKTVDGGSLWIDGAITNAANLAPSCIFGLNADTAWVAMWNVAGGAAAGKILRTNDGGGTWTQQTTALFNTTGNFPDFVYFWDANNGICLGDPTSGYFEIYTTTDGGTNWVRTPQANIPAQGAGEFGITDVFREFGDSTLYFGTNFGRIYKTIDRGLNWTVAQTPFTDFIGAIAFRDANNGLCVSGGAVGSTDVSYTSDGGATWNLKGTNTGINLTLGLCYVPGTDSTYFISTPAAGSVDGTSFSPNDGTSWVPVDNLIHTDIEFINDSTGWTGSNESNAPMMKWSTPIVVAADDAASSSIDIPLNTGTGVQNPQATFLNNGLNTQTFDVTMNITGGYSSTKTITGLVFNNTQQVTFDPWTPAAPGVYTVVIYTSLGADTNHSNDTLSTDVTVYPEFENYGWVSKPNVSTGTFGLGGSFWLNGTTTSSPGQLFSIGGADFAAIYGNNNAFNTIPNSWSTMPPMPTGKFQFSVQKSGDKFYAAGGYNPNFVSVGDMYIYDIVASTWNNGTPMPTPVGDYASGVYNDSLIYYIGGYSGQDENLVQIYNTNTDTWSSGTAKPGTATSGLRGGIIGDKIVVVGGYSQLLVGSIADAYIGAIDAADPTQITWTPLPAYPGGTVGRLAAGIPFQALRPLVIFVGGDPNGQGLLVKGDCWGYDVVQNQWLIGKQKITPVSNISDFVGLVYNDSIWMASVAGYDGVNISSVHEWLNLGAATLCGAALAPINPCSGSCNGTITLTQTGGVGPFSYLWSTGDTTTSINSLCAGSYSVTVTDSTGCTSTSQITIAPPVLNAVSTNTLCNGDCNGTASVSFQGALAPFTYLWTTSATTDSVSGLCAGTYVAVVQDANTCLDSAMVTITEPDSITTLFSGVNVLCNGQCNGSYNATVLGGTPPYSLLTCAGGAITPGTLCAGNYCVVVTDANGCTKSNSFVVAEPAPLVVTSTSQNTTCFSCTDGYIALNLSGGTVPYTITWVPANGNLSNDSIINLPTGVYTVTVTDANGCSNSFTDTITSPVGIEHFNGGSYFEIYPNPAANEFTVYCSQFATSTLEIFNTLGEKVYAAVLNEKLTKINCELLAQGIYFVKIKNDQGSSMRKLLVE